MAHGVVAHNRRCDSHVIPSAMSLRRKFLIAAIIAALAPMVSWQALRQTVATLRQEQEQSLLSQARVIARALVMLPIEALPDGASMPVLQVHSAIRVDGYADDWPAFGGAESADAATRIALVDDGHGLYLLADVRDATRQRADPRDPGLHHADYLELGLALAGQQRRYRIASAGPGRIDVLAADADDGSTLPDSLIGEWQEDGSGYRIELHLPRSVLEARIAWQVHDGAGAAAASEPLKWRNVIGPRPATARALQSLAGQGMRLRLLSSDGVVLASSDSSQSASGPSRRASEPHAHWQDRVLLWGAANISDGVDAESTRIDTPQIWQALSGIAAVGWIRDRDAPPSLTVAQALPEHGPTKTVLFVEQSGIDAPAPHRRALAWLVGSVVTTLLAWMLLLALGARLLRRIGRLHDSIATDVRGRADGSGGLPSVVDMDELGDLARHHARLAGDVATWTDYLRSLTSRLSHELNTPLAIVKSSLDNLEQSPSADAAREYLGRARDGADRLAAIVRAMSESNRIERAIASADAEDFDLGQLVAGCAAGYAALAVDRDIRIDVPATPLRFHGAPELIAQALDKLFDNARSFTPIGGWIRFSLDADSVRMGDEAVLIRVANQGPPLPLAMQDRLFDTLVSVRERSSRSAGEVPHLGLGLYVVKLVAELHRGDATACNLEKDAGVEFALRLRGMSRRRLTDSPPSE